MRNQFSKTNSAVQTERTFHFKSEMKVKTTTVEIIDSKMLCSKQIFGTDGKKAAKLEWLDHHELFEGETELGPRIMTPVTLMGDLDHTVFMMDAITGSLYNKRGRCMTSPYITMKSLSQPSELAERLLKVDPASV